MKCPYCHENKSQVIDSRDTPDSEGIRRRRQCGTCRKRYNTFERVESVSLSVVKKDGTREEYNRRKIHDGVKIACTKRPVSADAIKLLLDDVETEIFKINENEISSKVVGDMVVRRLRDLDPVAYIRFASVYRNFEDIESLHQAVESLRHRE